MSTPEGKGQVCLAAWRVVRYLICRKLSVDICMFLGSLGSDRDPFLLPASVSSGGPRDSQGASLAVCPSFLFLSRKRPLPSTIKEHWVEALCLHWPSGQRRGPEVLVAMGSLGQRLLLCLFPTWGWSCLGLPRCLPSGELAHCCRFA